MTDNTPDAPAVALLPCPNQWCEKSDPGLRRSFVGRFWKVSCDTCNIVSTLKPSQAEAIAAWNLRPTAALPSEDAVKRVALPADVHEFVSRTCLLATNNGGWFDNAGFAAISPLCDAANAILEKYDAGKAPEQIAEQEPQ